MRFSKLYVKTLKESPKEAEIISHKLMLRAGMLKKTASGIYTYLPLGHKVLKKVEKIVREEMENAGSLEILMPVLQPADIWKESGRWSDYGFEMFRLQDRHNREFALGPTHEEVITSIIRNDITSYKQLPFSLFQIQTKFRDERRPRFGLMRGREFLMKDAYSFHTSKKSLDEEFENMKQAYSKIFTRCGLNFRSVEADSGAIGGNGSQEFHVLANSGEDEIFHCNSCNYAANIEKCESRIEKYNKDEENKNVEIVKTPDTKSIEDVSKLLNVDTKQIVKSLLYKDLKTADIYLVLIRGDLDVNEIKLKNILDTVEVSMLTDLEILELKLNKGYIGPYKFDNENIKIIADKSVLHIKNQVCGANVENSHYINVNYGVDYKAFIVSDIKTVKVGDLCNKCSDGKLKSLRGIETGHIFKLGDKYSKVMNATVIGQNGKDTVLEMGCYGIGVSRTLAAAIEQNNDENGIIWPLSLAPFIVNVIPTNIKNSDQIEVANKIYENLKSCGIDVIIDDRDFRPGFKFKDSDLIGIPLKIIVGRGISEGEVEIKERKTGETNNIKIENISEFVKKFIEKNK